MEYFQVSLFFRDDLTFLIKYSIKGQIYTGCAPVLRIQRSPGVYLTAEKKGRILEKLNYSQEKK